MEDSVSEYFVKVNLKTSFYRGRNEATKNNKQEQ